MYPWLLEVLSFSSGDSMKKAYLNNRKQIFRIEGNNTVLNQLPAKFFEVLAWCDCDFHCDFRHQGAVQSEFISSSMMALTAYRIMPSMSRINGAIINLAQTNTSLKLSNGNTKLIRGQPHS